MTVSYAKPKRKFFSIYSYPTFSIFSQFFTTEYQNHNTDYEHLFSTTMQADL